MKVLITGSTGFLGKKVLDLLVDDARVTRIFATTRQVLSHPSAKVQVCRMDLSDPTVVPVLSPIVEQVDAVIHLAGLYRFTSGYSLNYQNNVLPATHLISAFQDCLDRHSELTPEKLPPLIFASSFAVGLGMEGALEEKALSELPPKHFAYSHTKGIAERVFSDSPFRTWVFRLGSLTGSMEHGLIEKVDGPYILLNFLREISKLPGSGLIRRFPVLGNPVGTVPLFPVDVAAHIFHQAVFHPELKKEMKVHLGAVQKHGVKIRDFSEEAVKHYFPKAKPIFVKKIPKVLKKIEEKVLRGNGEVFEFALNPVQCRSERFRELFPEIRVPEFREYQEGFFGGFDQYQGEVRS